MRAVRGGFFDGTSKAWTISVKSCSVAFTRESGQYEGTIRCAPTLESWPEGARRSAHCRSGRGVTRPVAHSTTTACSKRSGILSASRACGRAEMVGMASQIARIQPFGGLAYGPACCQRSSRFSCRVHSRWLLLASRSVDKPLREYPGSLRSTTRSDGIETILMPSGPVA